MPEGDFLSVITPSDIAITPISRNNIDIEQDDEENDDVLLFDG